MRGCACWGRSFYTPGSHAAVHCRAMKTPAGQKWMLWMMERAAKKNSNTAKFQLWQAESHPVELANNKIAHQKLDYTHYNPVESGFVSKPEDWKYSSATDYYGGKGLLEIIQLEPLMV